jgi:uncharacterized membrane protein
MQGLDTTLARDLFVPLWFLTWRVGQTRYAKRRSASEVHLASVLRMSRRELHSSVLSTPMPSVPD